MLWIMSRGSWKKARGNGFAQQSEGLQPDTMKNFLVAKIIQSTMSQWNGGRGWCEIYSVSLWKQPRFLSVWNSLEVNLSDGQGVDFQVCNALAALRHEDLLKRHKIHIHSSYPINLEQSRKVSQLTLAGGVGAIHRCTGWLVQVDWHIARWFNIATTHLAPLGLMISSLEWGKIIRSSQSYEDKWNTGTEPTQDLTSIRIH